MPSVLRTLLIADNKSGKLLYGHSIVWELSELDYSVKKWKKFTTSTHISVYFKDIDDESKISTALNNGMFDLSPDLNIQISFDFPESDQFFIEKSYDETNFSPFIGLCSFAKVHFQEFSPAQGNPADYVRAHKDSLDEIKERYRLDLLEAPHLVGSFTIFEPTRIEEDFKGIENEQVVGYKISLFDYFDLYKGAQVRLEAVSASQKHIIDFPLDGEVHTIHCGFVPDQHTTVVELHGRIIYKSSFALLKKIDVQINLLEEKKIVSGDKVIHQVRSTVSGFDV